MGAPLFHSPELAHGGEDYPEVSWPPRDPVLLQPVPKVSGMGSGSRGEGGCSNLPLLPASHQAVPDERGPPKKLRT